MMRFPQIEDGSRLEGDVRGRLTRMEIDGYTRIRPLGCGARGTVWRVRDGSGRQWAAKVLPDSAAETAQAFADARVCAIHELAACDLGRIALIQHIADGEDVETLATDPAWTREHRLAVLASVAQEVVAIHAAGLVHGDISAANIVSTRSGFRLIDPLLDQGNPTAHYRPPEWHESGCTRAGDIYALGILAADLGLEHPLWRRACSRRPEERPRAAQLAGSIRRGARRRRDAAPPPRRLESKNVSFRRRPVDPVRAELTRPASHRTETAPPPGRALRPIVTALLALAALVGGTYLLLDAEREGETSTTGITVREQDSQRSLSQHVSDLQRRRDAAIADRDRERLNELTAPGSPARHQDEKLMEALAEADARIEGLTTSVSDVREGNPDADGGVWVHARIKQSPYRRCLPTGCTSIEATPERAIVLKLTGLSGTVVSVSQDG